MKNDIEFYKIDKELNKSANSIYVASINISLIILIICRYLKMSEIPYDLFCLFFIGQLSKTAYKYSKNKNNIYFIEAIGCIIAVIALIILSL